MRYPILLPFLACALLVGCAEHKEYQYRDYPISRENAYNAMRHILLSEGYEIVKIEENWVNNLPELYLETNWNMRQAGSPYPGNDIRRRAYVRITTLYSERRRDQHQPLTQEDVERIRELDEMDKQLADMEHTRVSLSVNHERRSNIRRPLESDWIHAGPDNFEVAALLGRFDAIFGDRHGGASRPSERGMALREQDLRRQR